jgi:hypothetical protein
MARGMTARRRLGGSCCMWPEPAGELGTRTSLSTTPVCVLAGPRPQPPPFPQITCMRVVVRWVRPYAGWRRRRGVGRRTEEEWRRGRGTVRGADAAKQRLLQGLTGTHSVRPGGLLATIEGGDGLKAAARKGLVAGEELACDVVAGGVQAMRGVAKWCV